MSIYEYDEEAHHKLLYEEGLEDGVARGRKLGLKETEIHLDRVNQLHSILVDMGRLDDLKRATKDKDYQDHLMDEFFPEASVPSQIQASSH